MEFLLNHPQLYTIDFDYVKTLYEQDQNVYCNLSDENYGRKPYVGIVVTLTWYKYFIPLSSAKEKHTRQKIRNRFHFVREEVPEKTVRDRWVTMPSTGGKVWHILAVIDVRKAIPVKEPFYSLIDINECKKKSNSYGNLLQKEYQIIRGMYGNILSAFEDCYTRQMISGIQKCCCNFKLLESICDQYSPDPHSSENLNQ